MFDETNQAGGNTELDNLPDSLFGDDEVEVEEETATETAEENNESGSEDNKEEGKTDDKASEGENHTEGKADDSSTIRVKFNGEEKEITLSEARTLAQKGMNYDHVVSERDKNRDAFNFLLEKAKGQGITVEQLMEKERNEAENQRLEKKIEALRERDDDASEATLESLAKLELEAEDSRKERETARAAESEKNAKIEAWNKLFDVHPELTQREGGTKLSQEVFDLVDKNGLTPIEAYNTVRMRELEEKNKELAEQNKVMTDSQTARKKSVGSLSSDRAGDDEDEFLAGFSSY